VVFQVDGPAVFTSSTKTENLRPSWDETFTIRLESTTTIRIDVYDEDGATDEWMAAWEFNYGGFLASARYGSLSVEGTIDRPVGPPILNFTIDAL
jgi:hypothetical protein